MKKKVKTPKNKNFGVVNIPDYSSSFYNKAFTEKPCFCFQQIQKGYNSKSCTKDHLRDLVKTIEKLSQLTWIQITNTQKHGFGLEHISRDSINPGLPSDISKNTTFLALRFSGNAPMIGYREENVFHVLFLDPKFSAYNH